VLDISAAYQWRYFILGAGVNNALNASYFTRRAEGYPGPGIIPAEPLSAYLSIGFTLSSAAFKK
jgi:Fe(3+) dicitrate transport protein